MKRWERIRRRAHRARTIFGRAAHRARTVFGLMLVGAGDLSGSALKGWGKRVLPTDERWF